MTYKEENIINIAMKAAELLKDGRIERDDISGHTGLIQTILSLSDKFEEKNAGVDYDAMGRDYWLEIDEFAEQHLLEEYGREIADIPQDLNLKVILNEGVLETVLKDKNIPVRVEVVDVDSLYTNYSKLESYRKELLADDAYMECDHFTPKFDEEPAYLASSIPGYPVKVFAVSGTVRHEIYSGDWDECTDFCADHSWRHVDENRFQWDLEIVDEREPFFPEGYFDAVEHFSKGAGIDIENEYVRQHAEELVFCYQNGYFLTDFDSWTRYETLLDEKLSFNEASVLGCQFDCDPHDIQKDDEAAIHDFKNFLNGFRAANDRCHPSLDSMIQSASQKVSEEPVGPRSLDEINRNAH